MPRANTEDQLVEQPAIQLFATLGWETVSASDEAMGSTGTLGRETTAEVVLMDLVAWIIPKDVLSLVFSTLGVI